MRENYSIRVFNNLAINTEKALSVKVFYCLKGKCEVTINVQKHILEKDDIALLKSTRVPYVNVFASAKCGWTSI